MRRLKTALRVILAAACAAFLLFSPPHLRAALSSDPYRAFFLPERPAWNGILTLWHVVGFKPYQGSVTAYLESCVATYEKANPGIYVEVLGMDPAGMEERLDRGERPDIWSFSCGSLYPEQLAPLNLTEVPDFVGNLRPAAWEGVTYAVPYLYSGHFLLGNPLRVQDAGLSWPGAEGVTAEYLQTALDAALGGRPQLTVTAFDGARLGLAGEASPEGDFTAGQVALRIGDARAAGDLSRRQTNDPKAFTFDAMPLSDGFTDQVQYLGLAAGIDEDAAVHARALIGTFLESRAQGKIAALGAMPAVAEARENAAYTEGLLQSLAAAYAEPLSPDPFLWQRHRAALEEEAARAMAGDAAAKTAFDQRLRECMPETTQ